MKLFDQIASDLPSKYETNSASIVQVATKVCVVFLYNTAPLASTKMYPNIDLQKSMQLV